MEEVGVIAQSVRAQIVPRDNANTASSLSPADGTWCIFPLENLLCVLWLWAYAVQDGSIYTETMERR